MSLFGSGQKDPDPKHCFQMESPILMDNGYMETGEGRMRESYYVHCDDDFTPSPGMAAGDLEIY